MNIYYELKSPKNRSKEVTNLNSADVISWWKTISTYNVRIDILGTGKQIRNNIF